MSAIFGIYNLDGKPVDSQLLEKMSDTLLHRGVDDVNEWNDGSIGFGHRMLWTTPESLDEKLPKSIDNNDLVITADARIDNRDELFKQLDLTPQADGENISDSELILFAYKKWGEVCSEKLLGDFVFAIWDKRRRQLFCARDHFGVKPFYYFASENCFAFATEIKALFILKEVSNTLNEEMIADYLISNYEDTSATFYKKILRLPPASNITVTASEKRLHKYYVLDPEQELSLRSNEDYANGLREIFTESVKCRMRSAKPIGSLLSGGLDSSSIACVARNLQIEQGGGELPTFSLIYDRIKECDEREYINSVLAQGGFQSYFIAGDEDTPLTNLDAICRSMDRPSIGPGFSASWKMNKVISESGVRVIFDGHDGDNAVSHGYKHLDELAQSGQWLALATEAKELAPIFSMSQWEIMSAYLQQYRWKPFLRKHPRFKKISKLNRRFSRSKTSKKSWNQDIFTQRIALLNKDFAKRLNLQDRHKSSTPKVARTSREYHYQTITSGSQALALEECNAVSAAFGLETRYPFWDKRLIEYCLSLPGEQKCNNGWNRVVMRRAMSGILPHNVCWRREKTDFTTNFVDGLVYAEKENLKNLITDNNEILDDFFDRHAVRETYQKIYSRNLEADDTETRMTLRTFWNLASFVSWLQNVPNLVR
jgi:asparagine synthase (glutamine-hydrolysing)